MKGQQLYFYEKKKSKLKLFYLGNIRLRGFNISKKLIKLNNQDFLLLFDLLLCINREDRYQILNLIKDDDLKYNLITSPIILFRDNNLEGHKNTKGPYLFNYPSFKKIGEVLQFKEELYSKLILNLFKHVFIKKEIIEQVHSASLIFEDKGIFVLGQNSMGKSTLCNRLLEYKRIIINNDDSSYLINFFNKKAKFLFCPSDIYYRPKKKESRKKIRINKRGIEFIDNFNKKEDFFHDLDALFFIDSHIKGKSRFRVGDFSRYKDKIEELDKRMHLFFIKGRFSKDFPIIKIDLGDDLSNVYLEMKKVLDNL